MLKRVVMALILVALFQAVVAACPTCKEAVAQNDDGRVSTAFFWGIVTMMGAPFLLIGGFAGWIYYNRRRTRRPDDAA